MDETAEPSVADIKALCLRLLTRREHSQQELLQKLRLKGYSKQDCLPVIEVLTQQNWQSDSRYAEIYARSCIQRGYGPVFIQYNLRQHGVDDIDLDGLVQEIAGSWAEQIEQVYAKKYSQKAITDKNDWAKRSRFLLQRGFSQIMVNGLFDALK
ncbi:regulatory protein RecX [Crenothrix polyspora]|uniref:Regulatory protein RecX n=1 Tax=Crenothrix polyspora TaxID=360316 RepID=A0A1R4HHW8_9GAMM|nr:regulatory protein RecX [Crenothrix polyspora]SJM95848.1 Regulatory protein RecX [Crenothrix polyspora]